MGLTRRVGLFGGSFDPPHNAHVALARLALDALHLDELLLVPAGQPWQKADRVITPAADRLAMLHLAFDAQPRMRIEPCELQRAGPSYTVDTVRELQARGATAEWFLVIGQDQYARLSTWHDWQALPPRVTFAVAARAGDAPAPDPALAALPHRAMVLPLPAMPLSSSDVRARVRRNEPIEGMVPAAVADYIDQAHLYKD